jgi:hypothetical protein
MAMLVYQRVMGLNWCFVFSHQHWGCNIYTLIIDEGKSASHPIENPSFQYMYHFLNEYLCLKYVQEKQDWIYKMYTWSTGRERHALCAEVSKHTPSGEILDTMVWCDDWIAFLFNFELFKWNVFMLPFASANDDALTFFCYRWWWTPPIYIIISKNILSFFWKFLPPPHLTKIKYMRQIWQ